MSDRSYEILVCEHHRRALAYALSLVRSAHDAEDLVQEAFVTAYRNLDKFDEAKDFGAWLRGIVRNKYLELLRKRCELPVSQELLDDLDAVHLKWDNAFLDRGFHPIEALQHCLNLLQGPARLVVDLFYFDGIGCDDIADRLKVKTDAVWKRLERIRVILFECINKQMIEEPAS